ncbi:hypothetical protein [Sphingomonas sp.]|uniref:hypothetical protein n=1 Tax=Sphingomonas sp. TaxID=28214 RepID=UPI0031D42CB2
MVIGIIYSLHEAFGGAGIPRRGKAIRSSWKYQSGRKEPTNPVIIGSVVPKLGNRGGNLGHFL